MTQPSWQVGPLHEPYRVLVVDDSIIVRTMVRRLLLEHPGIQVVATAGHGAQALEALRTHAVDVVLLDLEMPVMDGLEALPHLLAASTRLQVIMATAARPGRLGLALSALFQGAADVLAKPVATDELSTERFRRELIDKVLRCGAVARRQPTGATDGPVFRPVRSAGAAPRRRSIALRDGRGGGARALALLCGEGGLRSLYRVLDDLRGAELGPVFVYQPLGAPFVDTLAEHLAAIGERPCLIGRGGAPLVDGRIYLTSTGQAPVVMGRGEGARLAGRPGWAREAGSTADALLGDLATTYGPGLLVVVLTGTGETGIGGVEAVVAKAGTVVAQVPGEGTLSELPEAVLRRGLASALVPLAGVAPLVRRRFADSGHRAEGQADP